MNFNVYDMKKNMIKEKRSDAVLNSLRQDIIDEILIYGENMVKETLGVYNNQKQIRIR